jgi:hypothetical protein
MRITRLSPHPAEAPIYEILEVAAAGAGLPPFSPEAQALLADFARMLARDGEARTYPELQALAFWLRKAELTRLADEFAASTPPDAVSVPRGLVFHVPPANVDTIFVYSWALSLLAGNRNIVRLSSKESPQASIVLRLLDELVTSSASPSLRGGSQFITYPHDEEITAAISGRCDVRVIWGGDATVGAIRRGALPPHAKEITFPDRSSLAAIDASAFLALGEDDRAELARQFYNDAYWFDQAGCSSPRVVVWRGPRATGEAAAAAFFDLIAETVVERGYRIDTAIALSKQLFLHQAAIDLPVEGARWISNEVVTVDVDDLSTRWEDHPGGGFFLQHFIDDLESIAAFITRRDQTLTHFGFEESELREMVRSLNGVGIDRVVPVGQALTFHRLWDGYDLLRELTRLVHVEPTTRERRHDGGN